LIGSKWIEDKRWSGHSGSDVTYTDRNIIIQH
jgi:hypothetical protein